MCGIAGILNIQSNTNLTHSIQNMTDALAHRGPDSGGFFVDENKVALGHRRLSIIDLSTSANQPFKDESGRFTLIFNGEIYNYRDIKRKSFWRLISSGEKTVCNTSTACLLSPFGIKKTKPFSSHETVWASKIFTITLIINVLSFLRRCVHCYNRILCHGKLIKMRCTIF
jgi:glutamine phosphoribosylpyrophosphate amidotransferase